MPPTPPNPTDPTSTAPIFLSVGTVAPDARLAVMASLFVVACLVLAVSSPIRRVGDGVEYWAMAEQLRSVQRPSASRGELSRLERESQAIGHDFDRSPLRFPGLVGADGRQDFPHFWLYSLVNVPALACVMAIGLHPNWAFTLTNVVSISLAFAIVARRISVAWAVLILAGPLMWWIDKAHGDVFTVALLAMACALWRTSPAWTVTLVALAAAQNPALMPVWAFTCVMALWPILPIIEATLMHRRRAAPTRADASTPHADKSVKPVSQLVTAVALSAAIVALPLAYYQLRLGIWSPLIGYTHPSRPSLRAVLSLLVDPNVGLVPNVPFIALAAILTTVSAFGAARYSRSMGGDGGGDPGWRREWILAAGAWILMLAADAQSVNLNHGATPGMNRWTLWLTPWLLLIGGPVAHRRARALAALAALQVLWSVWFFRPSVPEVYRYPTMTASWLWTHAPGWYSPAPEIFAERVSHREPAVLPVAWPGCTKVLIVDGQWPEPCVPTAPAPASCLGTGRLCYATPSASATHGESGQTPTTFTPLGTPSFPWIPAAHTLLFERAR
jgi:hypothetical protein